MSLQVHAGHSNTGQHGSNQSYDEFISQIQHDIKMAKGDPDKEFSVLDGNIMKLASKKVGSMFLQDYLMDADQQLINKILTALTRVICSPRLATASWTCYLGRWCS